MEKHYQLYYYNKYSNNGHNCKVMSLQTIQPTELILKTSVSDYVNYFIQKHKGLNNHLVNTK